MLSRYLIGIFYAACALAMLSSCGDSKAGGTGEFATVFATAASPGTALDLNLASTTPVQAIYTITSLAYAPPNTGSTSTIIPSNLGITKVTVTLTPANPSSPFLGNLQTQYPSSGQSIIVGSNSVPVDIVTASLKAFLQTAIPAGALVTYRAVVSFEALEVTTNRTSTIVAPGFLLVNFTNS